MARRRTDPDDRRQVVVEADLSVLAGGPNLYEGIGQAFADLHAPYRTVELEFLVTHLERSVKITQQQSGLLGR